MAARAKKFMLLFDAIMKRLVPQHSFRRKSSYITNKTRLISIIAQCITSDDVQCKQAEGDADILVVSTYQEGSNPMLVVAIQQPGNASEPGQ